MFFIFIYSKVSVCCGNSERRKSPRSQMGKMIRERKRCEHESGSSDGAQAQCSGHGVLPFIRLRVIYSYRTRRERIGGCDAIDSVELRCRKIKICEKFQRNDTVQVHGLLEWTHITAALRDELNFLNAIASNFHLLGMISNVKCGAKRQ